MNQQLSILLVTTLLLCNQAWCLTLAPGNPGDGNASIPSAGGFVETAADVAAVKQERATPEQIGIYVPLTMDLMRYTKANVRYHEHTDSIWSFAHPLARIWPEWTAGGAPLQPVNAFAGSIFDLQPGSTYQVEITLLEPSGAKKTFRRVLSTRALPPAAMAPTVMATPSADLQDIIDGLKPGDVLELDSGNYAVDKLRIKVSGTPDKPIYIRGASREEVVIKDDKGIVIQILNSSHLVLENFTLEGSGIDSGTSANSVGVSFWSDGQQEFVTLRDMKIIGVDKGVVAGGAIRSTLVYNNEFRGNNLWTEAFIYSNETWNDDGLRLPGEGNCGFQNTLHGFGDSFAVTDGVFSAAIHFYRNLITMTGDDAFEADYSTRNIGYYDNYINNSGTLLSLDPLWGGPLYCFRNVIVNTLRSPYKLNSVNSGFFIYNNTIVRTKDKKNWGWVQFNNGALRNWGYRNNLLISRANQSRLLAIESASCDPIDFTHNGWYPDGNIWWTNSGGSFSSLAEARNKLPPTTPVVGISTHRHEGDIITTSNPFISQVKLGETPLTEIQSMVVPVLNPASNIKNSGIEIPGITDGFTGSAPDIGAIIEGRSNPKWGVLHDNDTSKK